MLQSYIIYLNYQTITDFFCDKKDRKNLAGWEKTCTFATATKIEGHSPVGLERCSHIAEVIGSSPIVPTFIFIGLNNNPPFPSVGSGGFLYNVQEVTPSVVATAVRIDMIILMIIFHVSFLFMMIQLCAPPHGSLVGRAGSHVDGAGLTTVFWVKAAEWPLSCLSRAARR